MAIIEGHDIGGTCVNRGCVPSKALLAASGRVRELQNTMHLKSMGIQVQPNEGAYCSAALAFADVQDAVACGVRPQITEQLKSAIHIQMQPH